MVFPKVDPYSAKKDIERADRDEKSVANIGQYFKTPNRNFPIIFTDIHYKQSYNLGTFWQDMYAHDKVGNTGW